MNDDRSHDARRPTDGDANRALTALGRLPRARASADARERARAAFVSGAGVRTLPVRPRTSPWRRMTLLAAALLSVAAFAWFGAQPELEWVVLDVVGPAGVESDAGGPLEPGLRLSAGRLATGAESELEVQLGDRLRFRLLPGTELELPRAPGRWFDRSRRLPLESGEIYGTSGGGALGFDLAFATDELEMRLTGTTFAVFRTDTTSCVCLWEGALEVQPLVGPDAPLALEPLNRVWIYKDGRAPDVSPLDGMERMKLQMMEDAGIAVEAPPEP